jgi:hypothetical protein
VSGRVQLRLPTHPFHVVAYGGGTNTIAALAWLRRHDIVPRAIVMGDPGHEWKRTLWYRDEVAQPWLRRIGFPPVVVVTRRDGLRGRRGAKNFETLGQLCERTRSLPSAAYGSKKCSLNYKAAPSRWWISQQPWARAEWKAGRQLVKVIGYDADEEKRVQPYFNDPVENRQYRPWYPLYEARIDRDGCEDLIRSEGLPLPGKSACTFCPNNTREEWVELRETEPEAFAYAVEMSRRAASTVESPDVVGLMRCNRPGKRQLHVWADEGCTANDNREDPEMPCECAL